MSIKATLMPTLAASAIALSAAASTIPVNSDNFVRAESDLYFSGIIKDGGFAKFNHIREMAPLDNQIVIRLNRDTLYSSGVFDLDAGPVRITLPDAGSRFISMQVISEDHYVLGVYYEPGDYTLTRDEVGTRYVAVALRILANPEDAEDMGKVHALQDAVKVTQAAEGSFEIPEWDSNTQDQTRKALLELGSLLPDSRRMFGNKGEVDSVRHLIGAGLAWGGNPERDALYLNHRVPDNDGKAVYRLTVGEVPVDGFWSASVYNAEGYYTPNDLNAYTINNLTAKRADDGSAIIQFGGCDGIIPNCLPTPKGWNYVVRLYRPKAVILDGSWEFPKPEKVK